MSRYLPGDIPRLAAKVTALSDHIRVLEEKLRVANSNLEMVRTDREGVWFWQGRDVLPQLQRTRL